MFLGGLSYLHSDLRQVDLQRQLLPAVHVRVVGLLEGSLQLVQLEGGEGGPVPAVLLLRVLVVRQLGVSVRRVGTHGGVGGAAGATRTWEGKPKTHHLKSSDQVGRCRFCNKFLIYYIYNI